MKKWRLIFLTSWNKKEFIPLSAEQASLYEQLVKDTFEHMASLTGMQRKALILSMLGRLKQICDHPALYLKEEQTELLNGRSVKLEKLLDLMAVIRGQGESCLIFTQYIQMGNMMKRLLEKTFGEPVQFLNGSYPSRNAILSSNGSRRKNTRR